MTVFADRITYGFVFGTLVAVLLAVLCVGVIVYCSAALREDEGGHRLSHDDRGAARVVRLCSWLALAATVVVYVAGSWPFKHDYHWWVDKSGTVSAVSSRLIPSGDKSVQQRFVVVVGGQPLGVDDTRASLLKPGDRVSLRCRKENEWGTPQSAHGWKCKWNGPAGL